MKVHAGIHAARACGVLIFALVTSAMLSGCLVAGVSSSGGAFIWPSGFGLFFVILLVFLLLRRRR